MVGSRSLTHYFRLVRPINLAVVALTMLLFRYCIIDVKLYRLYDFVPYLSNFSFYILLIITLLVTAGGYVINDIFDVETDFVNKPEKIIVGKYLNDNQAFSFYYGLTVSAVLGSFLLMFTSGQMKISMLPIFIIAVLYVYASTFKRMPFIGNLIVSACAALPILLLSAFELRINEFDPAAVILFTQGIGLAALVYGTFAFLTNLIRELAKDIEDLEGDDYSGARTLPIVIGTGKAKVIILFIQLLTLIPILAITYYVLTANIAVAFYGISVSLIFPLLIQIFLTVAAKTPKQFGKVSLIGKIHMFLGVCTLLYFCNGTAPHFFNQLFNFYARMLGY